MWVGEGRWNLKRKEGMSVEIRFSDPRGGIMGGLFEFWKEDFLSFY